MTLVPSPGSWATARSAVAARTALDATRKKGRGQSDAGPAARAEQDECAHNNGGYRSERDRVGGLAGETQGGGAPRGGRGGRARGGETLGLAAQGQVVGGETEDGEWQVRGAASEECEDRGDHQPQGGVGQDSGGDGRA